MFKADAESDLVGPEAKVEAADGELEKDDAPSPFLYVGRGLFASLMKDTFFI